MPSAEHRAIATLGYEADHYSPLVLSADAPQRRAVRTRWRDRLRLPEITSVRLGQMNGDQWPVLVRCRRAGFTNRVLEPCRTCVSALYHFRQWKLPKLEYTAC